MNWILIPARKGSKGVPGKNTRLLAGKPLISYALSAAQAAFGAESIVVSTDDPAVKRLLPEGARVFERPAELAGDAVTLDHVAVSVAADLLSRGAAETDVLLTVQPTSPFLQAESLRSAASAIAEGAGSVLSVKDDRHLRWTLEGEHAQPLFDERVNRQWLPPTFSETGGIIGARLGDIVSTGTRIIEPVRLVELDPTEGLDIDTFADWAVAEFFASRRSIVIRADGAPSLGMGHVYRALALEHALASHELIIITRRDGDSALGASFLGDSSSRVHLIDSEDEFFAHIEARRPDIVILDVLDTEVAYVDRVKALSSWVVCIEDLGPGSQSADLVINDLYTDLYPSENHWYGVQYALLGPQFESMPAPRPVQPQVETVLVSFGGSDPQNLTAKALTALGSCEYAGEVVCVLGPGFAHTEPNLADHGLRGRILRSSTDLAGLMQESDLALTSAGRTVTELMTRGVPTIAMCQNERELMHTHASSPFGVMNLGLGEHVSVESLAHYVGTLIEDAQLRRSMAERMSKAVNGRSNKRIAEMILNAASGEES